MTVFLGIDPTSSDRKPSACALLDEDGSLVKLASPRTDADILELAARCRPDIVAIGAPLNLPSGFCCLDQSCECHFSVAGRKGRLLELELAGRIRQLPGDQYVLRIS